MRSSETKRLYEPKKGGTPARQAGLRFEAKITKQLFRWFPTGRAQASFVFCDEELGWRRVVLDFIVLWKGTAIVIEVKHNYVPEVWRQLDELYVPVVQAWRPKTPVVSCVIAAGLGTYPTPPHVETKPLTIPERPEDWTSALLMVPA